MVLPVRIELTTSALPRMRSTTELRQHVRAKIFGDGGPMAVTAPLCQGRNMSDKEKAERLAAKLRENLRRRKAQAREMHSSSPLGEVSAAPAADGGVQEDETPLSASPTSPPLRGREFAGAWSGLVRREPRSLRLGTLSRAAGEGREGAVAASLDARAERRSRPTRRYPPKPRLSGRIRAAGLRRRGPD